jgi:hypothetical protein
MTATGSAGFWAAESAVAVSRSSRIRVRAGRRGWVAAAWRTDLRGSLRSRTAETGDRRGSVVARWRTSSWVSRLKGRGGAAVHGLGVVVECGDPRKFTAHDMRVDVDADGCPLFLGEFRTYGDGETYLVVRVLGENDDQFRLQGPVAGEGATAGGEDRDERDARDAYCANVSRSWRRPRSGRRGSGPSSSSSTTRTGRTDPARSLAFGSPMIRGPGPS